MLGQFYGSTHSGSAPSPPLPLLLPFFCLVSGSASLPATCPYMLGTWREKERIMVGKGTCCPLWDDLGMDQLLPPSPTAE